MKTLLIIITFSLVTIVSYSQDFNLYEEYEYTDIETAIVNKENAYRLRLSGNSITDISPKIKQLTQLLELTIENTKVEELPQELFELNQLQKLNLSGNKNLTELPKEINNLKELKELNILRGMIEEFPRFNGLLQLESLNLSWNYTWSYPRGISSLPKLESVILGNFDEQTLPDEYRNMNQIFHLEISNSSLKEIPNYIFELDNLVEAEFDNLNGLEKVVIPKTTASEIEYLSISSESEFELQGEISALQNLMYLSLENTNFEHSPHFHSKTLKSISFSSCTFDTLNLGILHTPKLEELGMNNCSINTYLDGLSDTKKIKVLELSAWPFEKLPTEISSLKKLETLDISYTRTTTLGFLDNLKKIKELNLVECINLTNEDIKHVVEKHPDLKVVISD